MSAPKMPLSPPFSSISSLEPPKIAAHTPKQRQKSEINFSSPELQNDCCNTLQKQQKNSLLLNCNFFRCNTLQNNTKFCSKVSSPESAKEIAAISHSKTKQKFCNLQKKIAATHSKQQKNSATNSSSSELLKMQQTQNNKKNLQQNFVQQLCNKFLFF
jgi:hypothetical protein